MDIIRKLLIFIIAVVFLCIPVSAQDMMSTVGNINHDFTLSKMPDYVYIKNSNEIVANNEIIIPKNSVLKLKTINARQERRWHKSGYILTKLESFTPEKSTLAYDISQENIFLAVKKYEPVNKKEVAILATEIIIFTGASFYAPGVDIAYFFVKGAILREKHKNWFKAGVSNAYDNSIFWFWLKGKPIKLEKNSQIKIKNVDANKIEQLANKIDKYNKKQEIKSIKKQCKKYNNEIKKEIKAEKNFNKNFKNEVKRAEKEILEKNLQKQEKKQAKITNKKLRKEQKLKFKIAKKQLKQNDKALKKITKKQNMDKKLTFKKLEQKQFAILKNQTKENKKEIKKILKIQEHIEKNKDITF